MKSLATIAGLLFLGMLLVGLGYVGFGLLLFIAGAIGLFFWTTGVWASHQFLRAAPGETRHRMETVKEGLDTGAGHLEMAASELDAGRAPLFWDAMDAFTADIQRCRSAWNEAVDIAEKCEKGFPIRLSLSYDSALVAPDASLPAKVAELGERWLDLRNRSLGIQHFASIYEQRRQADKIAERLKKQGEEIQAAVYQAKRAEQAAREAATVAGQATAKANKAAATASSARSTAETARSTAETARSEASAVRSAATWSKL